MNRWIAGITTLFAFAALTGGCGSTPPSRYYTLRSTAAGAPVSSTLSVAVGPVSMPATVDRPQIVVNVGRNEVQPDDFNRWASPLADNLSRAVAGNLATLLGTAHVTISSSALSGDAEYRAAIEVQSFESALGEAATLDAVWSVRRMKDGKATTGRTTVREATQEKSYDALAAAHSRALGRLSEDIAGAIRALDRDGVASSNRPAN
jgi:uncharacterized lipoprotein YmbA